MRNGQTESAFSDKTPRTSHFGLSDNSHPGSSCIRSASHIAVEGDIFKNSLLTIFFNRDFSTLYVTNEWSVWKLFLFRTWQSILPLFSEAFWTAQLRAHTVSSVMFIGNYQFEGMCKKQSWPILLDFPELAWTDPKKIHQISGLWIEIRSRDDSMTEHYWSLNRCVRYSAYMT